MRRFIIKLVGQAVLKEGVKALATVESLDFEGLMKDTLENAEVVIVE